MPLSLSKDVKKSKLFVTIMTKIRNNEIVTKST